MKTTTDLKGRLDHLREEIEEVIHDIEDTRSESEGRSLSADVLGSAEQLAQTARRLQSFDPSHHADLHPANRSKLDRHLAPDEKQRKAELDAEAARESAPPPKPEQYLNEPNREQAVRRGLVPAPAAPRGQPFAPGRSADVDAPNADQTERADTDASRAPTSHASTPPGVTRHDVGPHSTHAKSAGGKSK